MNISDLELRRLKTQPSPTWLRPRPRALVKVDRFENGQRLKAVSRDEPKPAAATLPAVGFTADEVRSLHNDDAMAAGMISIILGLAFLFLLTLVAGVSIWTLMVAH